MRLLGSFLMSLWLRVIQINDVYELDRLANLATLVKEAKQGPDKTICIVAGDFLAPSLLSSLDNGIGMVDCLNSVGITHVCWGNHETDIPTLQIKTRVEQSRFAWVNSNMRDIDVKLDITTKEYSIVEISKGGERKRVCLLGLLTEDPSLYRPGAFGGARIEPVMEATERLMKKLEKEENVDLFLPMTHQGIQQDREFARRFGILFPIVMGGHDHEVFDETHNDCRIVKTGHDALNAAIMDFYWNGPDHSSFAFEMKMKPTHGFAVDPHLKEKIDGHQKFLKQLETAKLFLIDHWTPSGQEFSTQNNRLGTSTGSRALASMLRMGMCCQCCLINAGSVRGNKEYTSGSYFTWKDLKSEIPFSTGMTSCYIPGRVIEATIRHSRQHSRAIPPVAKGGYLHTCNNIVYNNTSEMIGSIQGLPFEPEAMYLTCLPWQFFEGIDNHEPLLSWYSENRTVELDVEGSVPAKIVLVRTFAALLWLQLGSFADLDQDHDGVLTKDEVRRQVTRVYGAGIANLVTDNVFDVADMNNDGTITPLEMMVIQFVATDITNHVCTQEELVVMKEICAKVLGQDPTQKNVHEFVQKLRETLDVAGDGAIHRDEILAALGELEEGHEMLK